jgi:hypothetical protein
MVFVVDRHAGLTVELRDASRGLPTATPRV